MDTLSSRPNPSLTRVVGGCFYFSQVLVKTGIVVITVGLTWLRTNGG